MSVLSLLYSQASDKGQQPNLKVVDMCLHRPELLLEIAAGLGNKDAALVGDCAEVFTIVAEQNPRLIVPYVKELTGLMIHKTTRVRWEAVHALALSAQYIAPILHPLLPQIAVIIQIDKSIIVRDYATDILANYALAGAKEAQEAYPLLKEALMVWEGRHAGHALTGLGNVGKLMPALAQDVGKIAEPYLEHKNGTVRKVAKAILKSLK